MKGTPDPDILVVDRIPPVSYIPKKLIYLLDPIVSQVLILDTMWSCLCR